MLFFNNSAPAMNEAVFTAITQAVQPRRFSAAWRGAVRRSRSLGRSPDPAAMAPRIAGSEPTYRWGTWGVWPALCEGNRVS